MNKKAVHSISFFFLLFFLSPLLYAENEPNNEYGTATSLVFSVENKGIVNATTDKTDWWILSSTNGVLKVRFKTDQKLTLTFYGNDPKKSVAAFTAKAAVDTILTYPCAGTQYIKISGATVDCNYSIEVNIDTPLPLPNDVEPNDDTTKSIALALDTVLEGNIGYVYAKYDAVDYYAITLPEDGFAEVIVTYYETITESYAITGISKYMKKGKHHFALMNFIGVPNFHYKLKVNFKPINEYPDDIEPNDKYIQALPLNFDAPVTGRVGFMGTKILDAQDIYSFNITQADTFKVRIMKDEFLTPRLMLTKENLMPVKSSDNNGFLSVKLDPGKYYLTVLPLSSGGSYSITTRNTENIPVADFDFSIKSTKILFNEKVNVPCTYSWNFDDGKTLTMANPTYTYENFRDYNVCLTAQNEYGKDAKCKVVSYGFEVSAIKPNIAGNNGYVSVYIEGWGFENGTTVKLVSDGTPAIEPDSIRLSKNGNLVCFFDLHDKTIGVYDVELVFPTGFTTKIEEGFTIETGGEPKVEVFLEKNLQVGPHRPRYYTLSLVNSGTVDARGIPLYVAISEHASIDFADFNIVLSQYARDKGLRFDTVPIYTVVDKVLGENFRAKVYALYIHHLPAGKNISRKIVISSREKFRVIVWTNKPYFGSPMNSGVADCILSTTAEAMTDQLIGLIPGASCAQSIYENVVEPVMSDSESDEEQTTGSMIWDFATMAYDCATSFFTPAKAIDFAVSLVTTIADIVDFSDNAQDCYKPDGKGNSNGDVLNSLDPNEKIGTTGYGSEHCINQTSNLPYTIFFENKATATAPAQEVFIIDTLDTQVFDLSTFQIKAFGFGDTMIYFNSPEKNMVTDVDLRPNKNLIVRFIANLDVQTGIVKWTIRSFDTATMDLPEDPLMGFLPPNISSPEGEGFVSYSISLIDELTDQTVIANKATIVFDGNEPITTNEYVNTLDFSAPASQIKKATGANSNSYELQLKGTDNGAGIQYYRMYISVNDSAYRLLKTTSKPAENFTVEKGKTYKLYSLAVDSLGNREMKTKVPDLTLSYTTSIEPDGHKTENISLFPNPAGNTLKIKVNSGEATEAMIEIYDLCGRAVLVIKNRNITIGHNEVEIDIAHLKSGYYLLKYTGKTGTVRLPFVKK